ncbi:hypothetical protein TrVE_jg11393 [Triparma verrucosa]|nr:hypothetical protein TrVE_jg11393 [Triparma verrucosa]
MAVRQKYRVSRPHQSRAPSRLGVAIMPDMATEETGMVAGIDLTGVAKSGMGYKAMMNEAEDFPTAGEVRAAIPREAFEPDTLKSLGYLSTSVVLTSICVYAGVAAMNAGVPTDSPLAVPFWALYAVVTGTVGMGNWVLAHECGHGAFSKNKKLQTAVGYTIHSLLLVPYFSWQRSHAVHHQFTNHMELGETHVPEIGSSDEGSLQRRAALVEKFGVETGLNIWGSLQAFLHLVLGWPAYLMIGATGGPARGLTNHLLPDPMTPVDPKFPTKELFPGKWKQKVVESDIGIAAVVSGLLVWGACNGFDQVMALYGGPYLIINAWLVLYTWLQHTDVDVPHFTDEEHNFVKGALHTIDRPYDKLDPWGAIDFLHHKIGTTHVAHHFDSSIPHYKAQIATDAIKEKFPQLYLYEPTPIFEALWRVCKGCTATKKVGDKYVWDNEGLEEGL